MCTDFCLALVLTDPDLCSQYLILSYGTIMSSMWSIHFLEMEYDLQLKCRDNRFKDNMYYATECVYLWGWMPSFVWSKQCLTAALDSEQWFMLCRGVWGRNPWINSSTVFSRCVVDNEGNNSEENCTSCSIPGYTITQICSIYEFLNFPQVAKPVTRLFYHVREIKTVLFSLFWLFPPEVL